MIFFKICQVLICIKNLMYAMDANMRPYVVSGWELERIRGQGSGSGSGSGVRVTLTHVSNKSRLWTVY